MKQIDPVEVLARIHRFISLGGYGGTFESAGP
jgi:hypothetical protein